MEKLIPVGKYKNQPVEILESDPNYKNWLLGQEWFRSGHKNLYTFIVNNFSEAQDTPEHNRLQALFLDDDFCIRFSRLVSPDGFSASFHETIFSPRFHVNDESRIDYEIKGETIGRIQVREKRIEECGIDVSFGVNVEFLDCSKKKGYEDEWTRLSKPEWRQAGFYAIEIKPTVGDDYPNVLRQMKSLNCNVLFLETYTGSGITCDQFIQMFQNERLRVVFSSELQLTHQLPTMN